MPPEVMAALVGSGVTIVAGASVMAVKGLIYQQTNGNGKSNGNGSNHHCKDHFQLLELAIETRNDVKWLKQKNLEDETDKMDIKEVLSQIAPHIKQRG